MKVQQRKEKHREHQRWVEIVDDVRLERVQYSLTEGHHRRQSNPVSRVEGILYAETHRVINFFHFLLGQVRVFIFVRELVSGLGRENANDVPELGLRGKHELIRRGL